MPYALLLLMLFSILSCTQPTEPEPLVQTPSGTYIGTFQRRPGGTVPVVLTFTGNRFSGAVSGGLALGSGVPLGMPRLCEGTFTVEAGTIYFQNTCFFTADFDWTLILTDRWKAETSGNRLVFTRNEDRYELTRQP